MIKFSSSDLDKFCLEGINTLSGAKFIKTIGSELLHTNEIYDDHLSTTTDSDTPHTWILLDRAFAGIDLSESFTTPLIIVYDELMPSRILIDLHFWLRRKCLNIENIILVTTHHLGSANWWRQWCNTMQEKSYKIIDVGYPPNMVKNYIDCDASVVRYKDVLAIKLQHLSKLFSYYGGLYSALERDYLSLQMSAFQDIAVVDYLGTFASKEQFIGYVESISYYNDQHSVDKLSSAYSNLVVDGKMKSNIGQFNLNIPPSKEKLNMQGLQWEIDKHCFATVVKETKANDRYPMVTEKTWRGFLHHCMVIPTSYQAVTYLEKQGYWFPHDLFDYSYQHEPSYHHRIAKLLVALHTLSNTHSMQELGHYLNNNFDRFQRNAELVFDVTKEKTWIIDND